MDKRQGWRGPLSNVDLSSLEHNQLLKYLQNYQKMLPEKRVAAVVKSVSKNAIKVLFEGNKNTIIEFKNASWARPQKIK